MMIKILLLTLFSLTACGREEKANIDHALDGFRPIRLVDERLLSAYNEFISDCHKYDSQKCQDNNKLIRNIEVVPDSQLPDDGDRQALGAVRYSTVPVLEGKYPVIDIYIANSLVADLPIIQANFDPRVIKMKTVLFYELGSALLKAEPNSCLIMQETVTPIDSTQWSSEVEDLFQTSSN